MTGQRQTRPGTPRMNGTDSFDEALDDDGELETADWEQLEEEDPVSEPAAIIDEILAARSNPSGDHDDGDENADAPAAAVVAAAEDPDADEDDDPEDPLLAPVRACGEDEFICQGCWLIKRRSQRTGTGDRCRDCD